MNLPKNLLKKPVLILSLVGLSFSIILLLLWSVQFHSQTNAPGHAVAHGQVAKTRIVSPGVPIRLRIPKINVDARVEPMGLLPNGDMQAPDGPSNVGWYKYGAHPGDTGNAVIAGHYGAWENGSGSIFDNLNKLQKGDLIYVQDQKGASIVFVVHGFKIYGPDEVVPAVFISSDGKAHLNLITCQGSWVQVQKSYSNRLVVFADKAI